MELEHRIFAGEVRKVESDGKTRYRFTASDQTYDRYHSVILADGWSLSEYKKNPIAFWAHESWKPPIGGNVDVTLQDSRLVADIEFAATPFAKEIASLVEGGFLRAVSVGFRNLEKRVPTREERIRFAIPDDHVDAFMYTRNELYEVSVVGVPGNPNALLSKLGADAMLAEEMATRGLGMLREKLEGRAEMEPAKCPACEGSGACACANCAGENEEAGKKSVELHPLATLEDMQHMSADIMDYIERKFDGFEKRFSVRPAARSYVEDILGLKKKADDINRNLRG